MTEPAGLNVGDLIALQIQMAQTGRKTLWYGGDFVVGQPKGDEDFETAEGVVFDVNDFVRRQVNVLQQWIAVQVAASDCLSARERTRIKMNS